MVSILLAPAFETRTAIDIYAHSFVAIGFVGMFVGYLKVPFNREIRVLRSS
jgi:hypothetical protein